METLEFRAMGSPCRIVIDGADTGLAAAGRSLVDDLESRWSRFLPSSEISDLNRHAGSLTIVSDATFRLVEAAVAAQERTGGAFHPLMLDQLDALGYRTPWQVEPASNGSLDVGPATHEPIELFPAIGGVRIPPGAKFDPGGIGKGLAIDLVTSMLVANGATTTSVELGGDLRVTGTPWYGPEWRVAVADPIGNGPEIAAFTISSGAVATSSVRRRRWHIDGVEVHHLLDPATGRPAQTDLAAVSVCAAEAWWADVAAKVALGAGSAMTQHWFERLGVTGLAVNADGRVTTDSSTKRIPAFAGPTTDGSRR